ncbi:MAG: diaminopimelate decarboxylase [bacterium]
MNYFAVQNAELWVEDVPLTRIASEYGTPTFVYSRAAIEDAYRRFDKAFASHPHRTCYSVKANSNLGVLSLLKSLGSGFDIVSGGELERVLRAGASADSVVFSGVGKQGWEVRLAIEAGIACFNIESIAELRQIDTIATELGCVAPISIRVNPDVDAKTHPYIATGLKQNKFGVSSSVARQMYREAEALPHIKVVGIDCHIGSQITELEPFIEAMRRLVEIVDDLEAEGIVLEHIDLGGGIGVRYQDETPIEVEEYAAAILQTLGHRKQSLMFEPGRYIVANAGILLSRVINLKENEGRHFAVIDAAMNDLIRPALYQSWQQVSVVKTANPSPKSYELVGPICETGDFIARNRRLALDEGDLVAIHSAGAYGFVMSSNYNSRNRAAEVIVSQSNSQSVRERETIEDQLRLERIYKC